MKCDPPDTAKTDFANSSRKGEIQENKLCFGITRALAVGTLDAKRRIDPEKRKRERERDICKKEM